MLAPTGTNSRLQSLTLRLFLSLANENSTYTPANGNFRCNGDIVNGRSNQPWLLIPARILQSRSGATTPVRLTQKQTDSRPRLVHFETPQLRDRFLLASDRIKMNKEREITIERGDTANSRIRSKDAKSRSPGFAMRGCRRLG